MDADAGAIVIGIAAFLSTFVTICVCRRKQTEPPPVVDEDPGDPQMLR